MTDRTQNLIENTVAPNGMAQRGFAAFPLLAIPAIIGGAAAIATVVKGEPDKAKPLTKAQQIAILQAQEDITRIERNKTIALVAGGLILGSFGLYLLKRKR